MNPYQAFPCLNMPPPTGRSSRSGGDALWVSVLIFRLVSAVEALARGLRRTGPVR